MTSTVSLVFHAFWFVLIFGTCLVNFVVCLIGVYDLFRNKKHYLIQKRTPELTALFVVSAALFQFGCSFPTFLMAAKDNFNPHLIFYDTVNEVVKGGRMGDNAWVQYIALESRIVSLCVCLEAVAGKLWLTYFDVKWNYLTADNEWIAIISTQQSNSASEIKNRFFVKYKWLLGSKRIICYVLLPAMVAVGWGCDWIVLYSASAWFETYFVLRLCAMLFLVALMFWDIPRVADTLHLWYELKWVLRLLSANVVTYILSGVVPTTVFKQKTVNWPYIYTIYGLSLFVFMAHTDLFVFYPLNLLFAEKCMQNSDLLSKYHRSDSSSRHSITLDVVGADIKLTKTTVFLLELWAKMATYVDNKWNSHVAAKMERAQSLTAAKCSKDSKCAVACARVHTPIANESDKIKAAEKRGVKGVLSDRNSLSVFMQHMMSEFSAENLLALVEFTQFNARFQGGGVLTDKWMIVLRDEVAQSDIVSDNDVYGAIRGLYDRYVANGAEYEINVSFRCKEPITRLVESNDFVNSDVADESRLHTIFNVALAQVLSVMRDSFFRWRRTEHFRRYALSAEEPHV